MKIEFDAATNARNIADRDLSFERAAEFDFETALYAVDTRKAYGEERIVALGWLDHRLHVLCFKRIAGGIRVISFRKANDREVKSYEQATLDRR